jgi:hypothetical protein
LIVISSMALDKAHIMLTTSREATSSESDLCDIARIVSLRGRDEILRMQPVLVELSTRCNQQGAMDYLEYFLTSPDNIKKSPYLVLLTLRTDVSVFELHAEDLLGAALVYEYRLFGLPLRLFNATDFNGSRAVVAPASIRSKVCAKVSLYLMEQHGAQVALLTHETEPDSSPLESFATVAPRPKQFWWTTQTREVGAAILLQESADATLASMGKNTRRNLKRYRRKAETELLCTFQPDVRTLLTRAQLTEINGASTHPVSEEILERRYNNLKELEGLFCVGVKTPDGQWISLLGGRRHHGICEIDWQINRAGLERYSVGTVIRSFLIEHEIAIGSSKLHFEGGTPHAMRLTFIDQYATDIIVINRSLFTVLLRKLARILSPNHSFLMQRLADPTLVWQLN